LQIYVTKTGKVRVSVAEIQSKLDGIDRSVEETLEIPVRDLETAITRGEGIYQDFARVLADLPLPVAPQLSTVLGRIRGLITYARYAWGGEDYSTRVRPDLCHTGQVQWKEAADD
jgi:hypothetical protein